MRNKTLLFGLLISIFLLGAATAVALQQAAVIPNLEQPFSTQPIERSSPSDTIKQDQIKVYKNGVYVTLKNGEDDWLINLDLSNPTWSTFTDTNSMDPVFDTEANTVRIRVPCDEIQEGDIITYEHENAGKIIHRVVHKDQDEKGPYFVLKGDNNPTNDPGKVRCEQILGKVVAIFY